MLEAFEVMKWPLIACLVLPGILVYLGLHIVRREIIFVDLALAQVAALGNCLAILIGHDAHDWQTYALSVSFTIIGAGIFSLTRSQAHHRVPQEALIGIVYVVAAAAGILVLSKSAGGKEELQRSLVGELLFVTPGEIGKTFALYLAIGWSGIFVFSSLAPLIRSGLRKLSASIEVGTAPQTKRNVAAP